MDDIPLQLSIQSYKDGVYMRIRETCKKTGSKKEAVFSRIEQCEGVLCVFGGGSAATCPDSDVPPIIRSLLNTHLTAGLYLNYFVKQLELEQ